MANTELQNTGDDQGMYADNEVTKDVDEKSIDVTVAWKDLTPYAADEQEMNESPIIFYDRELEEVCEVEKIANKKGGFTFVNKDTKGEKIYFGTQRSVANFFKIKSLMG